MMYRLLKPLLFRLDAETAHGLVLRLFLLSLWIPGMAFLYPLLWGYRPGRMNPLALRLWDREISVPVGLAAGFDKNGDYVHGLRHLAFGAIEVGTLTAKGQTGNPKPRLFRLPKDEALLNRMGFNNGGADVGAARLGRYRGKMGETLLGINIGKSKVCPLDEADADYRYSVEKLAGFADYLVVNVSSPNTPGLRDLQAVEKLRPLLQTVRAALDETAPKVPLLLKVAPDLSDEDLLAIADLAMELSLDGIIATNTTISRLGLKTPEGEVEALGAGGISGAPLQARSIQVLELLWQRTGGKMPLISVGGIDSAEEAWQRFRYGASFVQIYSGMIFKGPGLARAIAKGLRKRLLQGGFARLEDAIGSAYKNVASE